jgi:CubicO group peptidase (beta-lactamase class C family)
MPTPLFLRLFVPLLLGLAMAGCVSLPAAAATSSEIERSIQRIENGLLPVNLIEGEPVPAMAIGERMRFYNTPGASIAVIRDGRVEWARGYGVVDVRSGRPVDTTTLFQAASISKPVAAMAALHLVEQGRLSLDDDVNGLLRTWRVPENEWNSTEKVTLRRLLSHSAGLTVHGFRGYAAGETVPTLAQLLDGAAPANSAAVRVDVLPGSLWRYSGGGTCVAQQLMEDVTGTDFAALMRETVLAPASMIHSTYEQPIPADYAAQAASGHRIDGAPVDGQWHTYPEQAAAGLWTTPSDLALLAIEVQRSLRGESNRILSAEMMQEMLTKQSGEFGLGFGLAEEGGRQFFSHAGANEGFRAYLVASHDGRDGAVVMTNSDQGQPVVMEIVRAIAREYGWPLFQPRVMQVAAVDEARITELVGGYEAQLRDQKIAVGVEAQEGALRVLLPIWNGPRTLHPGSEGRWFFVESSAEMEFVRDGAGRVEAVRLTGLGEPLLARRLATDPEPAQ